MKARAPAGLPGTPASTPAPGRGQDAGPSRDPWPPPGSGSPRPRRTRFGCSRGCCARNPRAHGHDMRPRRPGPGFTAWARASGSSATGSRLSARAPQVRAREQNMRALLSMTWPGSGTGRDRKGRISSPVEMKAMRTRSYTGSSKIPAVSREPTSHRRDERVRAQHQVAGLHILALRPYVPSGSDPFADQERPVAVLAGPPPLE